MRRTARFNSFSHSQRHALDASRNLVIRANAGSGKTSVLIERIVQILARSWEMKSGLQITDIAAITFTRKAAAELQDRLQIAFEEARKESTDALEKEFWLEASRHLARAMIGTIDSLCGRILREFHWELQGPGSIEVDYQPLDSYDQDLLEQEAIARVFNRFGNRTGQTGSPEHAALAWWEHREGLDVLKEHLRALLRNPVAPAKIVAAHATQPGIEERCRRIWNRTPAVMLLKEKRSELEKSLRKIAASIGEKPRTKTLGDLQTNISATLLLLPDVANDYASLEHLSDMLLRADRQPLNLRNYKDVASPMSELQNIWALALEDSPPDREGEAHAMQAADHLASLLGPVHAEYLALCREANRYDFLTLARRTRDLLESSPRTCARLRARYRYLMVDEFQDTNLLQWEILSYLVGNGPHELLEPGRVCIVGDPQQSIFRFRQADVRVFQRVHAKIVESNRHHKLADLPMDYDTEPDARPSTNEEREGFVALAENYRSLSPHPLALMDSVFQYTFDPVQHRLNPEVETFEISYQRLTAGLSNEVCGEVSYVFADSSPEETEESGDSGSDADPSTDELIEGQVEAVADEFTKLLGAPRLLGETSTNLRWRDMAMLLPSRSNTLAALERVLRRRQIPFVVYGGIGFWQRQEVRDLVHLASWLADPGDTLSLFVVLRSPLAFLTDSEILFLSTLGRRNLWHGLRAVSQATDSLPKPGGTSSGTQDSEQARVFDALEQTWQGFTPERRSAIQEIATRLERWRGRADRLGHADLLQRALEESAAYALYAVLPEGEQILANLRQFFDRVRTLDADAALGLGRLARRLREQIDEFEKEGQANLAGDDDAVQIMTVHAAKGLEFPVVAVLKMEVGLRPRGPELLVEDQEHGPDPVGTVYVNVRHPRHPLRTFTCQGLDRLRKLDQRQEIAEKRRLFYVAGTRASERLILAGRATMKKNNSWQRWFEDALGIEEQHRQAGLWTHPEKDWQVKIISAPSAHAPLEQSLESAISSEVDVEPVTEASRTELVAATQLEKLREDFKDDRETWWLRRHLHLDPAPKQPSELWNAPASLEPKQQSALTGQLVHRLLMAGYGILEFAQRELEQRAVTLATALLESDRPDGGIGASSASELERVTLARAACAVLARLRRSDPAAQAISKLVRAPGKTEVPFSLALGRWIVRGRFDKLIPVDGMSGYTIVDWKTGRADDTEKARKRYRPQMMLYALALARGGQAARIGGCVQTQLVVFAAAEIVTLQFDDATLQAFGSELENELLDSDRYCESHTVAGQALPRRSVGG
jgi:ATP-dependent helicase/nuclease subunit A